MKKPSKDFQSRYSAAKTIRDDIRPEIEEVMSFICPGRENDFDRVKPTFTDDNDAETYMSLPEDLATDFAADMVNYFCPPEARWSEYMVTAPVPEEAVEAVTKIVNDREEAIFELIQSSNFNDLAPQVFFEANHGTVAMWVQQAHLTQPIYCETVPPNELLVVRGHMGILDRFREQWVYTQHLEALFKDWPEVDFSGPLKDRMKKPGDLCRVCWGFWVSWEDPGNPVWMGEVSIDGKHCMEASIIGPLAGGCPLLVGRFNPQNNSPWGRGPARKALPDMRVLNRVDEAVLEGLDQSLRNTFIYADDGFLDFEGGLEAGNAYAARRGFTRDQVYEMNRGVNLDTGFFSQDRLEERLRAGFYQDGPRQTGDTPPTATQWVDERRRVQQRIGKPSAPIWREFLLPFIQRIERIGIDSGRFDAELTHDGDVIAVLPVSPMQKASNQDKVMVTRSNLDLAYSVLQDQAPNVIDMVATLKAIVEASGDELTKVRPEQLQPEGQQSAPPPPNE